MSREHEQRTRQFKKVLKNERPFGFSALCGLNLFGYIELRFSLPPDGDRLGASKPPFSAVFQHIQKETGQIAIELPCTPNNSYHNGCQCHRIDLSAQPSQRKRYKTHKIPEIRRRLGF